MSIVTIDSGTTNTRVRVWQDGIVIAEVIETIGIRDTALTGSTKTLALGIKKALDNALAQANLILDNSIPIIASGMITSNLGLYELPHLITPIGINELANNMVEKIIPDITSYPIWFIPGIKNRLPAINIINFEEMDMMRGEETEVIGAINYFNIKQETLIILPGTHTKFVKINNKQKIISCATTMAGELLDVITQNTILAQSLGNKFADEIDEEYLIRGAKSCKEVGLARSCFMIRVLSMFSHSTKRQIANYLLGAVMYSDILTIKNHKALNIKPHTNIIICGKKILQQALAILISHDGFFHGSITTQNEEAIKPLSGLGAISIAQKIQLIK
ncbi:2-dehydro-3-deoxygalactonokinase [Providencia huaxiensis]|uniref:2-dehydro-3-deoxygalactonokinase n=1 Tax=Providencia TaxID=586 RepID=UPI000F773FB7|nr:2-dehydro-3-deoxygalactonokinase [Providencia rettgeri]MBV2189997.1 2-dehydro-3-deoxygalactonokinase [Providencia rettgeri]